MTIELSKGREAGGDYSFEATYYRTALLLGLLKGAVVVRWADEVIEREPDPPAALLDVAAVPAADLSALRYALWPLVVEPDPPRVIEALLGVLNADLVSGHRGLPDTLTILRQMRSMLRLPTLIYESLNAALVASAAEREPKQAIATWLRRFDQPGPVPFSDPS